MPETTIETEQVNLGTPMSAPMSAPVSTETVAPVQTGMSEPVVNREPEIEEEIDTSLIGASFNRMYKTKEVGKETKLNIFASLPTELDEGRSHPFDEHYNGKAKAIIVYSNVAIEDYKIASFVNVLKRKQENGWVIRISWNDDNTLGSQLAPLLHTTVVAKDFNGSPKTDASGKPVVQPALEIYIPWEKVGEDVPASLQTAIVSKGPSYEAMFKARQIQLESLKTAPDSYKQKALASMKNTEPNIGFMFKGLEFEVAYGYNLNQKASVFLTNHEIYSDFKVFKESNKELFWVKNTFAGNFSFNITAINLKTKSALTKLEEL